MTTQEKTFVAFTAEQARQYATGRGFSYPAELYHSIIDYHEGKHELLLDVGTGPGKVVFDMLPHFKHAVGCDASVGMIEQANRDAARYGVEDTTRFVVCGGEDCEKAMSEDKRGGVDVLTVAMAIHWMDASKFYASAAKALRPGGTLAVWTCSSLFCHPSTPNAVAVQDAMDDLENNILKPYHNPGNFLSRTGYQSLALPWSDPSTTTGFDPDSFQRLEWDRDGVPSAPLNADGSPGPFLKHMETRLVDLARALATSSSVIRYRDDHPETANTEDDPVLLTMNRMRELMGGRESLVVSPSTHLLLMRRL